MQKLHYSIRIKAPKEKVWGTLIGDTTYPEWTSPFMADSSFKGSWEQGSKIRFVAPDKNGKMGGMLSTVAENRPYEFISIKHLGVIENDIEDTTSEEAKKWAGGLEEYAFREANGITELLVDMDSDESNKAMFDESWPKSLQKLKELAEK